MTNEYHGYPDGDRDVPDGVDAESQGNLGSQTRSTENVIIKPDFAKESPLKPIGRVPKQKEPPSDGRKRF